MAKFDISKKMSDAKQKASGILNKTKETQQLHTEQNVG